MREEGCQRVVAHCGDGGSLGAWYSRQGVLGVASEVLVRKSGLGLGDGSFFGIWGGVYMGFLYGFLGALTSGVGFTALLGCVSWSRMFVVD